MRGERIQIALKAGVDGPTLNAGLYLSDKRPELKNKGGATKISVCYSGI